jgi:hypothetical protein
MMSKKLKVKSGDVYTVMGSRGAELLGLEPPYASAPLRPSKHFLYINKDQGFLGIGFAATYAAKKFVDILLGDDEISLTRGLSGKEDTIVSSTGIKIRCDEIMDIINYKYSEREKEWVLSDYGSDSSTAALNFRHSSVTERADRTKESPSEPKIKAEKKEKPEKVNKEGLISIAQIAEELKMEPRDARVILRKMKVPKPGIGWLWTKLEVDDIKKLLHDNKE